LIVAKGLKKDTIRQIGRDNEESGMGKTAGKGRTPGEQDSSTDNDKEKVRMQPRAGSSGGIYKSLAAPAHPLSHLLPHFSSPCLANGQLLGHEKSWKTTPRNNLSPK
jgi:hypothetical protein